MSPLAPFYIAGISIVVVASVLAIKFRIAQYMIGYAIVFGVGFAVSSLPLANWIGSQESCGTGFDCYDALIILAAVLTPVLAFIAGIISGGYYGYRIYHQKLGNEVS